MVAILSKRHIRLPLFYLFQRGILEPCPNNCSFVASMFLCFLPCVLLPLWSLSPPPLLLKTHSRYYFLSLLAPCYPNRSISSSVPCILTPSSISMTSQLCSFFLLFLSFLSRPSLLSLLFVICASISLSSPFSIHEPFPPLLPSLSASTFPRFIPRSCTSEPC